MKAISVDTEYSNKSVRKAELLSISYATSTTSAFVDVSKEEIQRVIDDADVVYTWNGSVDHYILTKNGINFPREKMLDAMLMEHLIDERLDHGLGDYALRVHNDNYKSDFWSLYKGYDEAPKEVAYEYEKRDVCYTFEAGQKYQKILEQKTELVKHVHNLAYSLFETEMTGVRVNRPLMEKTKLDMGIQIDGYLGKLREEYYEYCQLWEVNEWSKQLSLRKTPKGKSGVRRPTFSFSSDTQLRWLIYDAMECPVHEKTKKGNPKTDYETLKQLSEQYPLIKTVVDYKDIKAVYATFVEGMLERVEEDNRIYPTFFINGTHTGRISHANPNLGNLPREGVIRNFFIPEPGNVFVGADYSQLEVVVEANLTEDPNLLKIILEGASKHDITAEGLGISRDVAKTLNFGLGYGAGVNKVAKILGITRADAQIVFDKYWSIYSGVKTLKQKAFEEVKRTGAIANLFGRVRHFDKPKNEYEEARIQRQAYNFLVQGVGADITNMATYKVAERLKREQYGKMMLSIHDEILAEVKKEWSEESKIAIVEEMEAVNDYVQFKYRVQSKPYGALEFWSKE